MKLDWIIGQTEEEKTKTKQLLQRSSAVFEKLTNILEDYEMSLDRSERDISQFDNPNWEYRQAYRNGFRACLNRIKELIDIEETK